METGSASPSAVTVAAVRPLINPGPPLPTPDAWIVTSEGAEDAAALAPAPSVVLLRLRRRRRRRHGLRDPPLRCSTA